MMPAMLPGPPMLLGFGEATPIDAFLLAHPNPSAANVAEFLKPLSAQDRANTAQVLISRGVDAQTISSALSWLETTSKIRASWPTIAGVLVLASASASAFHGYRRNQSIAWSLWWFLMGSILPVVTPVIAIAQGFGKRKAG